MPVSIQKLVPINSALEGSSTPFPSPPPGELLLVLIESRAERATEVIEEGGHRALYQNTVIRCK